MLGVTLCTSDRCGVYFGFERLPIGLRFDGPRGFERLVHGGITYVWR
jgi:hypothetical protein